MKGKSRMPLAIMLMGVVFNVLNGLMQGEWLFYLAPEGLYTDAWLSDSFLFGFGVSFVRFIGMGINLHSDSVIRHYVNRAIHAIICRRRECTDMSLRATILASWWNG